MILDKCLLVWLFHLDRLSAIWFCLVIKIIVHCCSFYLIGAGPSAICLRVQADLVVMFLHALLFICFLAVISSFFFLLSPLLFVIESQDQKYEALAAFLHWFITCYLWLRNILVWSSLFFTFTIFDDVGVLFSFVHSLRVFIRWPEQYPPALCPGWRSSALQLHTQSGWGKKPTGLKKEKSTVSNLSWKLCTNSPLWLL